MKRNRLTRLLAAVLGALFVLAWAGPVVALDPLPPGEGPMEGSQNETGDGTQDRARDCKDEFVTLFSAEEDEGDWPAEGKTNVHGEEEGEGEKDRERNPETHED